jgi:heme oxygenase
MTTHTTTTDQGPGTGAPFSSQLRTATMAAHQDAERSAFVHRLFRGELPVGAVADLMAQHLVIYAALEDHAESLADDPVVAPFLDPGLERVPRLCRDLDALVGPGWEEQISTLPATELYAQDIGAAAARPERFLAHHYTRLLGDLSGGRMIRRALERWYGDHLTGALSFYEFDEIGDLDAFKAAYRARLDDLDLDTGARAAMVEEINRAYRHNGAVFAALDEAHPAA